MHATNPVHDHWQTDLALLDVQLSRIDIAGIHRSHRASILPHYPPGIRLALTEKYLATATPVREILRGEARRQAILAGRGVDSWAQANYDLMLDHCRLKACKVHLAWSDGAVRDMARQCADICGAVARNRPAQAAYVGISHYAARHQIRMPQPTRGKTLAGCVARLCDSKWWRRAIRSTYARRSEEIERELGLVCRQKGLYASDDSVARRREQKVRNRDLLTSMMAVNDAGECFSVAELSDVNVSNPKIRRAELMTRIAGFERYAHQHGHSGQFITLTLPSRFHCVLHDSGATNRKFDLSTVRDGHAYLCRQWSRLRSYLKRRGLDIYGFRISEPHHDGTPHWHMLVFMRTDARDEVLESFGKYFNPEGEPGDRRVRIVAIDADKGSAAGYIAKYVSKNIDGFGVGDDAEATGEARCATETAKRVDAWASTSGIRQFQQIGGPPVSVWRELRRIGRPCTGVIEDARLACEEQTWERFCEVMGGMGCRAVDRPVRLHTGRSLHTGLYGEPIERQIKGVKAGALIVPTRLRTWRIVRIPESGSPWTRVNNCTGTSGGSVFDQMPASTRPEGRRTPVIASAAPVPHAWSRQ
jgi:hypothetical protein